jgi:hypothetical protein
MGWVKYDGEEIVRRAPIVHAQNMPMSYYGKPEGVWITNEEEDNWEAWCLSERFALESLTHKHEVKLDEREILFLKCAGEIDNFTDIFGLESRGVRHPAIDWPTVASIYTGLIIAPYIWQRRLNDRTSWYYGWDCASGCIWDERAILDISLIEVRSLEDIMRIESSEECSAP